MAMQLALEVVTEEVSTATPKGRAAQSSSSPRSPRARVLRPVPGRAVRHQRVAGQAGRGAFSPAHDVPGVAWHLDEATIERGRRGLAEARKALAEARQRAGMAA